MSAHTVSWRNLHVEQSVSTTKRMMYTRSSWVQSSLHVEFVQFLFFNGNVLSLFMCCNSKYKWADQIKQGQARLHTLAFLTLDRAFVKDGSEKLSPRCWRVTLLSLPSFSSKVNTRLVEKLNAPFFNGRQEARVMTNRTSFVPNA